MVLPATGEHGACLQPSLAAVVTRLSLRVTPMEAAALVIGPVAALGLDRKSVV